MPEWERQWIDYYAILEIDRDADQITIKKAFHNLVNCYHPDVNSSPEAEEKFKLINEAYTVLSDETKKYEYDKAWDEHHEQSQNNYSNIDYEDLEKDYNEAEINYAKKMALKKVIEEELVKVEQIINLKNELLFNAVSEKIEKRDFYATVRELIDINSEYIESLKELAEKAYVNDLLEEEELIKQTIKYCSDEINNMPKTPKDAKVYLYKDYYKSSMNERVEAFLNEAENLLKELSQFWQDVYNNKINYMDYSQYTNIITINFKEIISKLTELRKETISLELEELSDKITNKLSELQINLDKIPKDYSYAQELGHRETLKNTLRQKLEEWNLYKDKIDDLYAKFVASPKAWCYAQEFNDLSLTLKKLIAETKKLKKEINNIITNNELDMNEYLKKALEIYKEAEKANKNADEIYHKMTEEINYEGVLELLNSVYTVHQKDEAILLLHKAQEIKNILYYLKNDSKTDSEVYHQFDEIDKKIELYNKMNNYFKIENLSNIIQDQKIHISFNNLMIVIDFILAAWSAYFPIEMISTLNNPEYFKNSSWFLGLIIGTFSLVFLKSIGVSSKKISELTQDEKELEEVILKLSKK